MIPRYEHASIAAVWTNEAKLARWDKVELAVIKARVQLSLLPSASYEVIKNALHNNPPNIEWWLEREKVLMHDLGAYVEERQRHLPVEYQHHFHEDMTSYDTEESAFIVALSECCDIIQTESNALHEVMKMLALRCRYVPFLDRSHGQGAKLRSFGGRVLTWMSDLQVPIGQFYSAQKLCKYSRLAGAIGNYGGKLSPELERKTLTILGFEPFYGSTQIMPRSLYVPLAHSLVDTAGVLNKIANDIRLGARSGKPICREPFGKKQKGSSAMPHKRNTILTEQMEGMERMARNFAHMIEENIKTWEARAIEQSCVERVAWPDLFHVLMRMIVVMIRVLRGLEIYQDHMIEEIVDARGTYASDEVKNFLGEKLAAQGLDADEAYRIVQLASFCVFDPGVGYGYIRDEAIEGLAEADKLLADALEIEPQKPMSIQHLIRNGQLRMADDLDVTLVQVRSWNSHLERLFADSEVVEEWDELFKPSFLLRNESFLFEKILG